MSFYVNHIAAKLHQTPVQLMDMLGDFGIVPQNGSLCNTQMEQLLRKLNEEVQNRQMQAQQLFERAIRDYVLIIDTNQILDDAFPLFMTHLIPYLQGFGRFLIVPKCVIRELNHLKEKRPELQDQINERLSQLVALEKEGLVKVYGSTDENFADLTLIQIVLHYFLRERIAVITADRKLSKDILLQNDLECVEHKKKALVLRINQYGYLSKYNPNFSCSSSRSVSCVSAPAEKPCELIRDSHALLQVDTLPETGDLVTDSTDKPWILIEKLSSGGEGTVYDLGDGTVAKIYRRDRLTENRRDKLELMVKASVTCPGICWPQDLLYNENHQFVGYRMMKAGGVELASVLMSEAAVTHHFPDWTKADTVQLCLAVLRMVCALHKRGILMGDINLHNILVESPGKVWFVDCDSYQIGGYACPVGTAYFTPPELQGLEYGSFLRTEGNENFALATLLFMIMMPGMRPYTQLHGESATELIREMNFPYPCGEHHSRNMPMGSCRYIWSHLPRFIKEAFYETFQKGGSNSTEQTRFSAREWLGKFSYYYQLLRDGKVRDLESMLVFPTRFKAAEPRMLQVYARPQCRSCGERFEVTLGEMQFLAGNGKNLPEYCPRCRQLHRLEAEGVFDEDN